jgi:putative ABC transport system substrate-binding protein
MLFALCQPAEAQQPTKVPRIGFLSTALSSVATRTEAFRQGLRELGYVEGKNIIIEWRDAEGKLDRLSELAAELVHLKLDVIVSAAPRPTRAAKEATVTIPVVMAFDNDPVGNGFVDSLARPGGNITGLSTYYSEISGKQLELLKEIVPRLSRVAVIGTSTVPGNEQTLKETELAAKAFGVKLQYLEIQRPQDIENVFRAARKGQAGAVLVLSSPVATSQRAQIAEIAAKSRLPAIYPQSDHIDAGGLMFYGPSINDLYRRAATYVDKILRFFGDRAPKK